MTGHLPRLRKVDMHTVAAQTADGEWIVKEHSHFNFDKLIQFGAVPEKEGE